MNLKTMKAEVQAIVGDAAFDASLRQYINEAYVAAVIEAELPEYKKYGSVTTVTDSNVVAVQEEVEDFEKMLNILAVGGQPVKRYDSIDALIADEELDALGVIDASVKAVAVEGKSLWYHPIPSTSQTIPFMYIASPELLVSDNDAVTLFPDLIQRKICIHGAAVTCFNTIEDGLEQKLNTDYHQKIYEKGILELKAWNGRRRTHRSTSTWSV